MLKTFNKRALGVQSTQLQEDITWWAMGSFLESSAPRVFVSHLTSQSGGITAVSQQEHHWANLCASRYFELKRIFQTFYNESQYANKREVLFSSDLSSHRPILLLVS